MPHILQPDLALAGWRLVRDAESKILPHERYAREKVLARAKPVLTAEAIDADPVAAVVEATKVHVNLLHSTEVLGAVNWARAHDPAVVRDGLLSFLHGQEPLLARAEHFLEVAGRRKDGTNKVVGFNVTAASYLACMADPTRHAFLKPASAFNPASVLLCRRGGDPAPDRRGAERLAFGAGFYGELRDLWSSDGFEGDLLDVHTVLFVLGCRGYANLTWADACATDPTLLAQLARQWQDANPDWARPVHDAASLMREHLLEPDPDRLLDRLDLQHYAYGTGRAVSFCSAVEHQTTAWVKIAQGNVSPHEVGRAKDGSWRLSTQAGHTEEEARQRFESSVKPRLEQLAACARAWLARAPAPDLTAPKLLNYRMIDAKSFLLLVAALDPDRAAREIASIVSWQEQDRVARLLGATIERGWGLTGYLQQLDALRIALERLPDHVWVGGAALASFWFEDPGARVLASMFEEADADEPLDEDAEQVASATTAMPTAVSVADSDPWEAFLVTLDEELQALAVLLRDRHNVVLYGPPGTGKTYLAGRLARAWRQHHATRGATEVEPIVQVTFHPSFGYEEFIEAWRPGDDGGFELVDGPLSELAARAHRAPSTLFLLFIDELNRGDVARIFGELITLVERDKRKEEHARLRMLSRRPLWLPENLYVLGTMNTADKSISLLDVAIRRRFAFRLTRPQPHLLVAKHGCVEALGGLRLADLLVGLNRRLLAIGVPPDRAIGHAVLMLDPESPVEKLADRLRYDLIPLVEEYCFSDRHLVKRVLGELVDGAGLPVDEVLDDESRLLAALHWIADGEVP